jgi:hypothetical protein
VIKSDKCSNIIKYELSEEEIITLYYSEPRLAILIDLDIIRLVDNHLVVNLKEFITPHTHHLTAYAKRYKSICCVGIQYTNGGLIDKKNRSQVKCTLDMLLNSSGFIESAPPEEGQQTDKDIGIESDRIGAEIDRINEILKKLPGSFSETLKEHMENKGFTEELLSSESWVSVSTIKQYRQNEDKNKKLKTVAALCVGMHLHPWFTEDLLFKAGVRPKNTKADGAYKFVYTFLYKYSIEDCNKYLKSQNVPEFKLVEKKSKKDKDI